MTRDAWIDGWQFEEDEDQAAKEVDAEMSAVESHEDAEEVKSPKRLWDGEMGSGYPSGDCCSFFPGIHMLSSGRPEDTGVAQIFA